MKKGTFVININRAKDRMEHASKELKKQKVPFQRWSGIDGNRLGLELKKNNRVGEKYTGGKVGCYLSMFSLLLYAQENEYDEILVFEDDIVLPDNFRDKLASLRMQLPDSWDMLYLYSSNKKSMHEKPIGIGFAEYTIHRIMEPIGNVAVLINKSGIEKIVKVLSDMYHYKDVQIAAAIRRNEIEAYAIEPDLVKTGVFWSNIRHWPFGGWSIDYSVFEKIQEIVPKGGNILEFGSGEVSAYLTQWYRVVSVEHNKQWVDKFKGVRYVHAPLVDGWYDANKLKSLIFEEVFDLVIVDGPPKDAGKREKMALHWDFLPLNIPYIFDDAHRDEVVALARDYQKLTKGELIHIKPEYSTKSFIIVTPKNGQ